MAAKLSYMGLHSDTGNRVVSLPNMQQLSLQQKEVYEGVNYLVVFTQERFKLEIVRSAEQEDKVDKVARVSNGIYKILVNKMRLSRQLAEKVMAFLPIAQVEFLSNSNEELSDFLKQKCLNITDEDLCNIQDEPLRTTLAKLRDNYSWYEAKQRLHTLLQNLGFTQSMSTRVVDKLRFKRTHTGLEKISRSKLIAWTSSGMTPLMKNAIIELYEYEGQVVEDL